MDDKRWTNIFPVQLTADSCRFPSQTYSKMREQRIWASEQLIILTLDMTHKLPGFAMVQLMEAAVRGVQIWRHIRDVLNNSKNKFFMPIPLLTTSQRWLIFLSRLKHGSLIKLVYHISKAQPKSGGWISFVKRMTLWLQAQRDNDKCSAQN